MLGYRGHGNMGHSHRMPASDGVELRLEPSLIGGIVVADLLALIAWLEMLNNKYFQLKNRDRKPEPSV